MRLVHLSLLAITACSGARAAGPPAPASPPLVAGDAAGAKGTLAVPTRTGDVHDFDFLLGAWSVHNRVLRVADDGTESWLEFPSTVCNTRHLGGVMSLEETEFPTRGYSAVGLRTFDLKKRQWSIYWIESRGAVVLPPVVGGFEGDRGEFYAEDDLNGERALFRLLWLNLGSDRARWEQSATTDGVEWKTNWVMEFTRTGTECRRS
jgi:hypothetical protein